MNLLIGIFGGMLLTAALYGAGRHLGLSNFWAAVAAAALPSFAYLVYAVGAWPGLDVVTLHVIAYPTVAILLSQLYGAKADHGRTLHWAPKLMIAFFLVISLIFGVFVYVAGQGLPPTLAQWLLPNAKGKNLHTGFAGVVEHQADAAKGIGHHLKMEDKLATLGWQVDVSGLKDVTAGRSSPVSITLLGPGRQPVGDATVAVDLVRPGRKDALPLGMAGGDGAYHGMLPPLERGTWVARIVLAGAGETVRLEHTLEVR